MESQASFGLVRLVRIIEPIIELIITVAFMIWCLHNHHTFAA